MPKISVIVPVYNTEKYLAKCLDSILNQTYQDIEIIIVNDGSTDNSDKIINEYVNNYSEKIKYFKKENSGIADTRNYGIGKVSGEYFLFVDSDDYIEKNLLEELTKTLILNPDIVKYKMKIVNKDGTEKVDGPIFNMKNGQDAFNELCFKDILIDTPCLYLFNLHFYKYNKFAFLKNTYHEDFGLIPLIILKSKNCISIDFYGYNYIHVDNSITNDKDYDKVVKRANDLLLHYDNMIKIIKSYDISNETRNNIRLYFSMAIFNINKFLKEKEKNLYKREIKKRRLISNIKIRSIKTLVKKIFFTINLYINN